MADKRLFASMRGRLVPEADTTNAEGALAYAYAPEHQLAQISVTGTLGQLFYASPEAELATAVRLAEA
ncbi:MAG: RNA-binding protein, partial [Pseudomonadota bacterium]